MTRNKTDKKIHYCQIRIMGDGGEGNADRCCAPERPTVGIAPAAAKRCRQRGLVNLPVTIEDVQWKEKGEISS